VREIDSKRYCIETRAVGHAHDSHLSEPPHTDVSAADLKRLVAWSKKADVTHRAARSRSVDAVTLLAPTLMDFDLIAGPLVNREGPIGALIAVARPGMKFDEHHVELIRELLEPFSVALENHHRLHELASLREAAEADKQSLLTRLGRTQVIDTIVGVDAGLRPVMARVQLVAKSDVPVLILGETGSGKEVIARAVHNGSPRAHGPFIRVNCGAIPPELIDSQLFGHEKGAFTGATDQRKGWFERADGGTLFLDEIGELPLAAQVRLLRVLQDHQLERVGGEEQVKVDVRIIAATHRDLASMVREGRFREDLWYRIAVFPVLLPPLRERKADIAALATHFAQKASTRFGLPHRPPTETDIALLTSYHWPGNVRELAAVIDRAAILGNGQRLEIAKAIGAPAPAPGSGNVAAPNVVPVAAVSGESFATLDEAMKRHIELALERTHGRIEGPFGAAKLLGINPHTLRARMRKLRLAWAAYRPGK
jgi:transcriptional regulator with GAF, ATPase, and Fis domain